MFISALTFTVLWVVALATAQTTPTSTMSEPPMDEWYPFKNPGEILPDGALTIPYILDVVGGFWTQYRLIDSYVYLCSEVLPELAQRIPEIGNMSGMWEPVCEEVISSRDNEDGFNATEFCNALVALGMDVLTGESNMTAWNGSGDMSGMPGMPGMGMMNMTLGDTMMPGLGGNPEDLSMLFSPLLESAASVAQELYGIDINDPMTICPLAHHFLEPSLPKLIYDFETKMLSTMLTSGEFGCDIVDEILGDVGINSTSPLYPIAQEIEALVYEAMGFDSKQELCDEITEALTNSEAEDLATEIVNHLFFILTDEDACGTIAHGVVDIINDVIMMMTPIDNSTDTPWMITDDVIYQYTGFMSIDEMCETVDKTFSGCPSKGFDRDACNVCSMSTEDGAPSFLSSGHRDCDMKCPLDMDSGAMNNECGYCVLGGTGLDMNEGLNECNECGEDTSCIGCDGEPNSGAVFDNCDICAGNHTDCMIVVTIKPSAVPENMDYNITVHGAGFHQDPTPVCLYTRVSDSEEFNATMKVMDPSMGYCRANLEPGSYSFTVLFDTTPVMHGDNLKVFTPITVDNVSEDVFLLGSTPNYVLRFTAADELDFTQAKEFDLDPYLVFLYGDEDMAPAMGFFEGDTTLTFDLEAPSESVQVMVAPSFNGIDLLPTTGSGYYAITFYDPPPQLDMATLSFKPTGNVLILEFPTEVSIKDNILPDCDAIFVATIEAEEGGENGAMPTDMAESRNLLGEGSRCYLTRNHEMLEIMLGQGDNLIEPGETLTVREGVIYGIGEYPSAAEETDITVSEGISTLVGVVLRGASTVSSCGNVCISARETIGGASRSFTYMWTVSPADSDNLTEAVNGITTSELDIDSHLLAEDVVYTFTAFATNFLGGTGVGTLDVVRTPEMVPDITIVPSAITPRRVMLSESFYLHAQVTFYSDCEGAEPTETDYTWSTDHNDVILDETTKNSRSLYVPAFSLPADTSITFTVAIQGANGTAGPNSDVTITTHSSDPVAVIVGGRERNIGIGSGLVVLDGSASRDPDRSGNDHLEFTWRCVQIPENILCVSNEDGSFFPAPEQVESPSISFNASHMAAGKTYEFTLMVSTMYKESPGTSVFVYAMPGNPPQVLVSRPGDGPVLATKPLALTAHVIHTGPVDITWSIIGEIVAMDDTDFTENANNRVLDGSTWSVVHIESDVLRPGEKYVIVVTATDELDQSASSQMELVVASGVSSCQLHLETGYNYTELEEISFTVDHCVADDGAYPLSYQLLAADEDGNERSLTPAGVLPVIDIVGPPAHGQHTSTTFVANVCNSHGSCTCFSLDVSVEMKTDLDSESVKDIIVSQETFKGNYLKAFTNLNALIYVEDRLDSDMSQGNRRRRRATDTSPRATDQLMLLHNAITTTVLDKSMASTLIDACEAIPVHQLSPDDTENFLWKLQALVSVFGCDDEIPPYSASVVLSIVKQIMSMTDKEETIKKCRKLTMSLTKANFGGLTFGGAPAETSSSAVMSTVYYDIPQGQFSTKTGEGAFYVDFGSDIADMYGGYWNCWRGLCTGVNIQFDHYSQNIDPYSSEDDDSDNRASAILKIALYDPSSCEELMVDSLSEPIHINMSVTGVKRNHRLKCHIWDEDVEEWTDEGVETEKLDHVKVECMVPRTGTCVVLAIPRGGASTVVIILVSIIGVLLALTLIVALVIFIMKKRKKAKGEGNVATNDRSSAVATAMTSDGKQMDGSQEASTEYAYDFNMQNMAASKVNC
ncbi:uncharacterized protein LOC129282804 [Lytechinus pictus]|uniref:uncharacterized protein LOC129282804 n=1 Tax=Lytechinus pictus TaxID=7653 RepID=UPI0030BA27CF